MSETSARTHASAVITVHKYEPAAYDEPAEGPALTRIHVEESFSGDISGEGVVEFLQAARADGSASFCRDRTDYRGGGRPGGHVSAPGRGHGAGQHRQRRLVRDPGIWHRPAGRTARRGRLPREP